MIYFYLNKRDNTISFYLFLRDYYADKRINDLFVLGLTGRFAGGICYAFSEVWMPGRSPA